MLPFFVTLKAFPGPVPSPLVSAGSAKPICKPAIPVLVADSFHKKSVNPVTVVEADQTATCGAVPEPLTPPGPVAPVAPVGPVAPVAPVGPIPPVAPVAPVTPV